MIWICFCVSSNNIHKISAGFMDRNSSIGMPPFPTMKVCIGENFSLKILMPLLVVRRPLFTSIAMHL